MTEFLKQTPSQAAGLVGGGPTAADRELWDDFKQSPDARAIQERRKAEKLEKRERDHAQLVTLGKARIRRNEKGAATLAEAKERLRRAEVEHRASLAAIRALPMGDETGSQEETELTRELIESADPRIEELAAWLERELFATRCYSPPPIISDRGNLGGGSLGFDQGVLEQLAARMDTIRVLMGEVRELRLQPLSEDEVTEAILRIRERVPAIPDGTSQVAPTPAPLELIEDHRKTVSPEARAHFRQYVADEQRIAAQAPKARGRGLKARLAGLRNGAGKK